MTVEIRSNGGKQTVASARSHLVICDQPLREGGNDAGMTPPELMLSALGCCAMHYAMEFLRARNLGQETIEISVSAEKTTQPARLAEIAIHVTAPALTGRMQDGLVRAVEACLLHRTLADPPRVKVTVETLVPELQPQTV